MTDYSGGTGRALVAGRWVPFILVDGVRVWQEPPARRSRPRAGRVLQMFPDGDRDERIRQWRERGASYRVIAAACGVSHETARAVVMGVRACDRPKRTP